MKSDIVPLFEACIDGTLHQLALQWKPEPFRLRRDGGKRISRILRKRKRNFRIGGKQGALPDIVVFHAGTKAEAGKVLSSGGRVLGVTSIGSDIPSAIKKAYEAVAKIQWDGIHYRKDIGHRVST